MYYERPLTFPQKWGKVCTQYTTGLSTLLDSRAVYNQCSKRVQYISLKPVQVCWLCLQLILKGSSLQVIGSAVDGGGSVAVPISYSFSGKAVGAELSMFAQHAEYRASHRRRRAAAATLLSEPEPSFQAEAEELAVSCGAHEIQKNEAYNERYRVPQYCLCTSPRAVSRYTTERCCL